MPFLSSAKSVQSVTTKGYHRCGDSLYLQVSNQGTKSWLFRYKSPVTKKQREMGLGSYKFVDLAQARQKALENKKLVIEGKDPIEERKAKQIRVQIEKSRDLTFKEIAEACIASKSHELYPSGNNVWWVLIRIISNSFIEFLSAALTKCSQIKFSSPSSLIAL